MPNQFLSDEFGDIEDYFMTDYRLIDNFVGDTLFVVGNNSSGQLGINDTTSRNTPVTTFAGGTTWKFITSGWNHTAAIKTDGTLWVWGSAEFGQLGINASEFSANRSTPVTTFAGGNNWKQVAGGWGHTAAIKTDGTLWGWGWGGLLGINNNNNRSTPVTTFAGGTNWKFVAGGGLSHSAAIKTDGTLWVWGDNGGRLGTNDITSRNTPVTTFAGGNNWKQVSCGTEHTVAIKTDGTLWVWGNNGYGQLGTNNTISRSTPVTTFAGGNNWKSVASGWEYITAIKTDGSLWTWGRGGFGQLGNNSTTNRSTPVTTFTGGNNWKSASGGKEHTAAIKTDGTLWVWGYNFGNLGTGDGTFRSTPTTTFAGGNNWKQVSAAQGPNFAIKSGLNVDLS